MTRKKENNFKSFGLFHLPLHSEQTGRRARGKLAPLLLLWPVSVLKCLFSHEWDSGT